MFCVGGLSGYAGSVVQGRLRVAKGKRGTGGLLCVALCRLSASAFVYGRSGGSCVEILLGTFPGNDRDLDPFLLSTGQS